MSLSKQSTQKVGVPVEKQRSYGEIIEFLDKNWNNVSQEASLQAVKKLDKALGSVAAKVKSIALSGTNGKSLTAHFTTTLLKAENLVVGTFYAPHILSYNERFQIDAETIANKKFADLANEVINVVETEGLAINTAELLLAMGLVYFHKNSVDVAILEVGKSLIKTVSALCSPMIVGITRVIADTQKNDDAPAAYIEQFLELVKAKAHVVSADQSKANLQIMADITATKGGTWDMPIRKLAPLEYPFEQLHGRCAALAERIARVYINQTNGEELVVTTAASLLSKQKGRRGRPTLEAKRQSELNPKKTMEQFWRDNTHSLPCRFQLLDKEKPTILLDTANNLDAFKNLLLGIRLLHYQRPLKGLTLVIGCDNPNVDMHELLKLLRYFFKKTSGNVIFCPATADLEHKIVKKAWDPEEAVNGTKVMKIKARATKSFKEAFRLACKSVDERNGLVVITGSSAIVSEYWIQKGVKKF